jgi:transcriptional regulator with PAS, ATPase and Fis domain
MQSLDRVVERIAAGSINVLILGETGVGKEVLAERVHQLSRRAAQPFLRLNCSALSESLLESELFGHERGAFTGAVQAKPGLLETANGGTVFLDEVGELDSSIQVKLLRVIEERQLLPVGGLTPRRIDVRFVAATNRDLEREIACGGFRQDLFFRLNGISLVIPPLRQRVTEIAELARGFIARACARDGQRQVPGLSREALVALQRYPWPGNIRELRNHIERAVLLCTGGTILPDHLPLETVAAPSPPPSPSPPLRLVRVEEPARSPIAAPPPGDLGEPVAIAVRRRVAAVERERILEALDRCAGNQTLAAELLGLSRRTLTNKLNLYDLPRPRRGRR